MKIFFDLDGTLIDVAPRHYRVYCETLEKFDGRPLSQETYWDLKRKKTKWPELLELSGVSSDVLDDFLANFIVKIEDLTYLKIDKLFAASLEVISDLSKQHECYLVSLRRSRANLLKQIAWLQLADHFTSVLTGHSESDGYDVKIALIEEVLRQSSGLIIGDTEADIVTGKKLGIRTVAVESGIRDPRFLAALKPDNQIAGIADLPKLIRGVHVT